MHSSCTTQITPKSISVALEKECFKCVNNLQFHNGVGDLYSLLAGGRRRLGQLATPEKDRKPWPIPAEVSLALTYK